MNRSPSVKTRLCWHCEGIIAPESRVCPYCATDLFASEEGIEKEQRAPRVIDLPLQQRVDKKRKIPELILDQQRLHLLKLLIAAIAGLTLLLFGFVLLLFSTKEGFFSLQWDSSYAPLYLLGGGVLSYYAASLYGEMEE